jgi:hypothetical protein
MIHEHHQWLADVNDSIVESYKRDEAMAREPGQIQRTGHRVESRWKGVLRDWLPPQYEVGDKRKYLLLETEDGPTVTKETDLVVFYPHYPEKLRDNESVLASGVAAAFSIKRTIGRDDIKEAYEDAVILRRGMKIRGANLQAHLIPPVFFGLLGESHDWKAPASTPKENIKVITDEFDRDLVRSPREGLDLLCVADLGTWSRTTAVLPQRFMAGQAWPEEFRVAFTGSTDIESLVLSGMRHDYEQTNLSPLTNFIGSLWGMLAINDPTLKPLADGFRITKTVDTTGKLNMGSGPYKLADVATPKIANGYRNHEPWSY